MPTTRTEDRESSIQGGAIYALINLLMMWLYFGSSPNASGSDMAIRLLSNFILLVFCCSLLFFNLSNIGRLLPDNTTSGYHRASVGGVLGVFSAILLAALTHALDNESWIFKVFWVQLMALPGAYYIGSSPFLTEKMGGKEELFSGLAFQALITSALWLGLDNWPPSPNDDATVEEKDNTAFCQIGLAMVLLVLFFLLAANLHDSIECIGRSHITHTPSGKTRAIVGSVAGVVAMAFAVIISHALDSKGWLYQLLWSQLGALAGAYFVGNLSYVARLYESGETCARGVQYRGIGRINDIPRTAVDHKHLEE